MASIHFLMEVLVVLKRLVEIVVSGHVVELGAVGQWQGRAGEMMVELERR